MSSLGSDKLSTNDELTPICHSGSQQGPEWGRKDLVGRSKGKRGTPGQGTRPTTPRRTPIFALPIPRAGWVSTADKDR